MHLLRGLRLLSLAILSTASLAGCMGSDSLDPLFDPLADVPLTGNTIHLKMSVIDYNETGLYPGLTANMWAFCAEPFEAGDAYSAAAIEYFTPLATDVPHISDHQRTTCSVPGPTIRAKQGDRVIVEFSHTHFHPHTIHWHGQFVDNEDDGVPGITQQAVGGTGGIPSFTYDFIAKRPGTLWYHCHVDTQYHVMQGLYGMFIVDPQDTSHEPKVDSEAIMVLSTANRAIVENIPGLSLHQHPPGCYVSGTPNCQNPPLDTTADVFLLNGHSYPYTEDQAQSHYFVDTGKSLRIRMLNAGNTVEEIHLHGHDMLVTHKDGLPLSAPYYADTIAIGPAERYDVVVVGHNPGVWAFHTHVNNHEANDQQVPGGMHTTLADGAQFQGHGHDFPAELAGGVGYQKPAYIPGDFNDVQQVHFGSAVGPTGVPAPARPASAAFTFPVEMPCTVQAVRVSAALGGVAPNLDDLTVTIVDGAGTIRESFALGGGTDHATDPITHGAFLLDGPGPGGAQGAAVGNWTVLVAGRAAASDVTVTMAVDHFGSFDQIKYLHRLDKNYQLCGRYGNGSDGLETKAPPP